MEPFNTPKVFVNPNIASSELGKDKKKWTILGGILVIIIIFLFLFIFNRDQKRTPSSKESSRTIQTKDSQILTQHPELFYVNLSLETRTNVVTQLNMGKIKGDLPVYLNEQLPATYSATLFIYKVEVISDKNELLLKGWRAIPIAIAEKTSGFLNWTVLAKHTPNALVKVYLNNGKLVWTGRVK